MRARFSTCDKDRMIHIVVYVHAATDPVQENLVEAIGELVNHDSRGNGKYLKFQS